ncbi:MAG: hypothetical protein EOO74_05030 [Myxococcales bacterium]|nr:MAG: hypothetical protein EOO74_05030 [Myxococcales bacterium]
MSEAGVRALRELVLARVASGVRHLDDLCEALQMPAHEVLVEATELLLEGALHEPSPGVFSTHPAGRRA